ncbi:MAG: RidA family protein [Anaerolineales bacterium]|nr:RidA family protein [Anaerolineales bacterium]
MKKVIIPQGGAKPLAPYSPGILVGDFLYTSGQIGIDPTTGKIIPGGVSAETKMALENLTKIIEAAGLTLKNIVKTTIFMTDIQFYSEINQIYGEYFKVDPPARSAIQVSALPAGALVEIEAVAVMGK